MNRRSFIRALAVGAFAGPALAKAALKAAPVDPCPGFNAEALIKLAPRRAKVYPITCEQRERTLLWLSQQKHEFIFEDGEKIEWYEKMVPYQGEPRLLIGDGYYPDGGIKWATVQVSDKPNDPIFL